MTFPTHEFLFDEARERIPLNRLDSRRGDGLRHLLEKSRYLRRVIDEALDRDDAAPDRSSRERIGEKPLH